MRNLILLNILPLKLNENILPFFTVDLENNIYAISEEKILYTLNSLTNQITNELPLETDDLLESGSEITGCQHIPDLESVCISTKNGDILLYDISKQSAEIVGCLDSGIITMKWSPDYELVVFVTENGSLIEMTKEWDIVTEVPIETEPETQIPIKQSSAALSWRGDGKVFACLSSSEGKLTSVLRVFDRACIFESKSENNIDVENNNLSWRPSGSLITCTQNIPNQRYDTIFFERNGLRHGEFTFPTSCSAKYLDWNSSSDLLAILIQSTIDNKLTSAVQIWHMNNYHWYLKQEINYGEVGSPEEAIKLQWDEEDSMKLRIISKGGKIEEHLYHWECNISLGLDKHNNHTIGVIDGSQLLITPLRRAVPPPPMSTSQLKLTNPINQIFFTPKNFNLFILLSNGHLQYYQNPELPTYLPPVKKQGKKGLLGQGEPPNFNIPFQFVENYQIKLPENDGKLFQLISIETTGKKLLGFYANSELNNLAKYFLLEFQLNEETKTFEVKNQTKLNEKPLRIYFNPDFEDILISLTGGNIFKFFPKKNQLNFYKKFPTSLNSIQTARKNERRTETIDDLIELDDESSNESEEIFIGLTSKGRLFLNDQELSKECSSFYIHEKYILYTTLSHKLRFIDLSVALQQQINPETGGGQPVTNGTFDILNREVERGSRIVSVISHDSKVILQMPRGNLEIIYPRPLLLSHCIDLMIDFQFHVAFMEMRRHRVDLNLLYDYHPSNFMENLVDFIKSLDSPSFLNLFLSSLIEEDTTTTIFSSFFKYSPRDENSKNKHLLPPYLISPATKIGKVNKICSAVRQAVKEIDENRYILTTLTTLVKNEPPLLGEALEIIRTLKKQETENKNQITAEAALDYLIFLVDVNKLYNVALSLYDFDLTIIVASKSQKDPKEYLPFLKNLYELKPIEYQRFKIDLFLENYQSALENISKLIENNEFYQEALQLITEKKLFTQAIKLFNSNKERLNEILKIYANYLFENENKEEAANIYHRCGELKKSYDCYSQTTNWQMIFTLARKLNFSVDQLNDLCKSLSNNFRNLGRFQDAATIILQFTLPSTSTEAEVASEILVPFDPVDQAIDILLQGCLWKDVFYLLSKYPNKRESRIEQIENQVATHTKVLMENYQSKFENYHRQFERLKVVKTTKILLPHAWQVPGAGPAGSNNQLSDAFSDTSSFASTRSSFSFVSVSEGGTKRRRRKPKKRISGKEGSPYEEEYLVDALKKLIPSHIEQNEIRALLDVLLYLGLDDLGFALNRTFSEFTSLIDRSLEVLVADVVVIPGSEDADDIRIKNQVALKEKFDRTFSQLPWQVASYQV